MILTGRKTIRWLSGLVVLAGVLSLADCPSPIMDQITQRVAKASAGVSPFSTFTFTSALNNAAGISIDCVGTVNGSDIEVTVPYGTALTSLKATFTQVATGPVSIGSSAQTSGQTANDFTSPVQYTLKADDGNIYTATVTVTIAPNGVLLSQSTMTLAVGGTLGLLQASVTPASGNVTLNWTSSNTGVAKVSAGGLPLTEVVTPVAIGTATITAKTADGSKSATCVVTVSSPVAVTGIAAFGGGNLAVGGESGFVSAVIYPSSASNQNVTWSSSDVSVVSVTPGGLSAGVTPVGVGTANVTVTTADGGKSASITFTVTAAVAVTAISLPVTASVAQGATVRLDAVITPGNATNQNLSWTTSAAANVKVTSNGFVTGVTAGNSAIITATSLDGSYITANCLVSVTAPVLVSNVSLNQPTLTLSVSGNNGYLTTNITPSTATKPDVTWTTSDSTIASIAYSGPGYAYIHPVAAGGPVTITATTTDTSNKSATCAVTVTAAVPVSGISLNQSSLTLAVGQESQYIQATVAPSNASVTQLDWTSDHPEFASIAQSGSTYAYIAPVAIGTATITAKSKDGSNKTATCVVTVTSPKLVTGVSLSRSSLNMSVGSETQYIYTSISPSDATNAAVTWTTSDPTVASIQYSYASAAYIQAVAPGDATITATSTDGSSKTATCTVHVTAPVAVTGVMLNYSYASIEVSTNQYEFYLTPTLVPSNATNTNVSWTSSDPTVASIGQSGPSYAYVTGLKPGQSTITATTADGSFTATCLVDVTAPVAVTGITINTASPLALTAGTSTNLSYSVSPGNATNRSVVWTSSNSTWANVSVNGQVTGLVAGKSVTITGTTVDGSFTATITVNVN